MVREVGVSSAAGLRRANRNRVFRFLYNAKETVTKQDVAYGLSMSLPTLTQNLNELLEMGLIDNSETADSSGGRKPRILSVVPQSRWALGVELSANHIRLVAVDLLVREVGFQSIHRPFGTDEAYGKALADSIEAFIDSVGLPREKLLGVGIAVPGIMDQECPTVTTAYTLGVQHWDMEPLLKQIPYPVYVVNDANAGGWAESWGHTDGREIAYLSLSRGVGGAIILSGGAYLGEKGKSGEFGHMCIQPGGVQCSCGRRGCLEAYCSTARLSDDLGLTLEQFFAEVSGGNPEYARLWADYLDHLAVGISNIHTALDCHMVIGGKLSKFLSRYLEELLQRLQELAINREPVDYLSVGRFHDRSNGTGAALYFIDQFIRQV